MTKEIEERFNRCMALEELDTRGAKPMKTRAEHLQWAKDRALEYFNDGDLVNAVTSMASDLEKHPDLGCTPHLLMLAGIYVTGGDREGVKRWIEGFR